MKTFLYAAAIAALLAGCNRTPDKPPPTAPRVEQNVVTFDAASAQLGGIVTQPAEARRESVVRLSGRLVWDEDRTARMFSPFAGKVVSIAVRPGDTVKQGQELALLAAPELGSAQADARKAEQDNALAQKNLARVKELHGAGIAPEKELFAARADAARASPERERTLARLKTYGAAGGTVDQRFAVRSPVAGVVVERNMNPGQEVRPDAQAPLFVISDPSHLWFMLDVAEKALGSVRPGQEVSLSASALGDDRVPGKVTHVADVVDPQTRSVKVRGTVANPERRLKAEMFVNAEVKSAAGGGLVVPTRAVYLRGDKHYVFVETGAGRYERRKVKIGPADDGHQVVLEGLGPAERVVVDGNLQLEKIVAAKE